MLHTADATMLLQSIADFDSFNSCVCEALFHRQTVVFYNPQKKTNVKCKCLCDQYRTKKASQLLLFYQIFFFSLPSRTFISAFLESPGGMLHISPSPICVFVAITRHFPKGVSLVAFCCQAKYYGWICVFLCGKQNPECLLLLFFFKSLDSLTGIYQDFTECVNLLCSSLGIRLFVSHGHKCYEWMPPYPTHKD